MTPFVILADLRTGSTLLSSTLDRHPEVTCWGELLHTQDFPDNCPPGADRHALDGRSLVRRAFSSRAGRLASSARGFRAMVGQPEPTEPQWSSAWDELAATPGLRVIELRREDRLAQFASLRVAAQTGIYHHSPGDPVLTPDERPRFEVDPEELLAWAQERDALFAQRRAQLGRRPFLVLTYEQLTQHWPHAMARVQHFLGVAAHALQPAKQKQETRPLAQVILNYEQARTALALRGS